MESNDRNGSSAIGLDVGTSRVVAAQQAEQGIRYAEQLNAFVNIPYSRITESVLQKELVPYTIEGAQIVVHGNESQKFADLLRVETRHPMDKGFLNPQEPDSLGRLAHIIATLCGRASDRQTVYFSVPAAPLGGEDSLTYHETTVKQVLSDLGYKAKPINEGLAVVYAELQDSNYTGIGISCGGGLCNVCLAYLSMPVFSFSIPKAGDFIDASSAAMTGERANRIRIAKEESFRFNGHFAEKAHQVLAVYYDDMIRAVAEGLKQQLLAKSKALPRLGRPIPLVLSGGSTLPQGFRDRFEAILKESEFPLALSEIRMAESPLHSTAKGALVVALIDG